MLLFVLLIGISVVFLRKKRINFE
ncbi:MAG: hypothetical protein KGD57_10070 [Candidatus Lokiarchaeota archaeon]|nr:hypothetical protein [Candidatus Lokiarchaeota archaeon]